MSRNWNGRTPGLRARIRRNQVNRRTNRRLLLETLGARQLLAGDMPMMVPSSDTPSLSSLTTSNDAPSHAAPLAGMMAMNPASNQHVAHPATMDLVSADQATNTVVSSGDWSDPAVWQDGAIPETGARIIIPHGMVLTVDSVLESEYKTIGIHGTLRFATDMDTELKVDTIVSSPQGRFEMGSAANPIPAGFTARVVFADDGVIDTSWDPEQLSRGAVLQGQTEIHGAETTHRVTLASFPSAGATSIELSSVPVNWNAGDQIVITGTQGSTSDEVRTIASIEGTSVSFNDPLQLDHIPPQTDLNVYVANTTRNVQLSSENPAVAHRGHIMLMHTLDVNIQNAEFKDLGRTDKSRPLDDINFEFPDEAVGNETSAPVVFTTTTGPRTNIRGRYAVHFHRGGVDPGSTPATVAGSVIQGSPGWGLVNHSANVNMINNVTYGVQGAAFYTEVGDEIGSMVGNIAIRTVNPAFTLGDEGAIDPDLGLEQMNFGVDGDGYWLSGHMVSMRDNVAAGASGHGIIIWSDGVIEPDLARGRSSVLVSNVENGNLITGRETIPTWWAPLAEINNNESYGATIGFRSRYVHSAGYLGEIGSAFHTPPDQAYIDTLSPTIDGLTVWGSRDGMLMNYNERMSIKNARLVGINAPYVQNGGTADTGVGIDMYNEVTRGPGVIENVTIEGFNMGLLAPRQDTWTINNVQLSNTTDMLITEARQGPRDLQMTNVTFESLEGTAVEGRADQRQNIVMSADFDSDAHQPFFFLMSDRITLNGQQLYFNAQAAGAVPITQQIDNDAVRLPNEMIGQSNQQLMDRYGTSFGGAITPEDAKTVSFLSGGVAGSLSETPATSPPLYNMASEGADGILVDAGTLTNFDGPILGPGSGGEEDGDEPSEDSDDEEDDDSGSEDGDEDSDEEDSEADDEEEEPGESDDEEDDDSDSEDGDEDSDDEDSEADDEEEEPGESDDEEDEDSDSEDGDEDSDDEDSEADDEEEEPGESDDEEDEDSDSEDGDEDSDDEESEADDEEEEPGESDDEEDEDADSEDGDEDSDDEESEADDEEEEPGESDDEEDEDADSEDGDEDSDREDSESDDDESDPSGESQPTQNPSQPMDVNGDGRVTALDALMVINRLSRDAPGLLGELARVANEYFDVNGDARTSALDALMVINHLSGLTNLSDTVVSNTGSTELSSSVDFAFNGNAFDDDAEERDDLLLFLAEDQGRGSFEA